MPRRLPAALLALALAAPAALAQREFGFDNRKASGQPYLTPEETVKRMKVAPEFEVKLFAGEPQLVNPIAFTIDEKGRVWCVECFEYPSRTPKGKAPRDRIVILEDTDGDGTCDKRTVFAEGKDFPVTDERKKAGLGAFDMASGIEVGHGGVFVGAPPYLFFIENKDDKPGKFDVLLKGFGSQDTHETLNTFQWGPDGWLYGLHGVFTHSTVSPGQGDGPELRMNAAVWRYHPRTKKFEIFAEGTSNPWGLDWRNTDGQFILACCVIPHLYHMVPGGIYKRQGGVSFNPYAYGAINEICDHTFHRESGWAHAGLISLDVPHIPEKYRNSVIFGSIHGCSVKQNVLKPNGSSFTASKGEDFLVSGDKNFRPINLRWGPNGDIYLIDWHDQNPCHQAAADSWDYERGRVYRIQLKGTKPKKAEDLGKLSVQTLAERAVLGDNPWEKRTALRLLATKERENYGVKSPLSRQLWSNWVFRAMMRDNTEEKILDFLKFHLITAAAYPGTRVWGYRFMGQLDGKCPETVAGLELMSDTEQDAACRREIASAAIRLAENHDVRGILHGLMKNKQDAKDPLIPHLVWLAYEKVVGKKEGAATPVEKELAWLAANAAGNPFVTDHIVPKTMRRLVATGQPADLALCLKFVADSKDTGVREKALDGLAVALKGQTVSPPAAWAALQTELAKEPQLVPLANQLAVSFRDPAALKRALAAAKDTSLKADDRAEAVRQLGALRNGEAVPLLLQLLRTDPANAVRAEAARSLAAFDTKTLAADILKGWKEYPPAVRSDVVNTLATRKAWAKALLDAMAAKTVDRAAVSDNTILRIQAFKDPALNKLIETAWGRTRTTPAELTAQIDKTRASLFDAGASFARGRLVFENNCGKCHKFDGKGAEVGPPLDGAARDIEYILTNVIDPNRVIGAPYFLRIARLQDGTVQQGLLAEEDDKTLTLKVENGALKKIAKADLEGPVQVVEKSMMPEGLTASVSPQDFRDLVRYLMANPFLTDVTVNGEKAAVGAPGRIALPDTKGGPTVIEAEVTATDVVKTALLVGSSADYEVRLDGKALGTGKGTGNRAQPDRESFEVALPKGVHRVAVVVKGSGGGHAVFVRFLDPDRKLRYPDAGEKK